MSQGSDTAPVTRQAAFRGHIAELDTLRALGLTMVLTDHFWPRNLSVIVIWFWTAWLDRHGFFLRDERFSHYRHPA